MVNPSAGGGAGSGGVGRRASGSITSPARIVARTIDWKRLERLSRRQAVVTGDTEDTSVADEVDPTLLQRPLLVFVHDDPDVCDGGCQGACGRYFEAEEAFSDERIQLATRAFRAIRITSEAAAEEPLLAERGDDATRIVILDVTREEAIVLEGRRMRGSTIWSQLRKVADGFYRERLSTVVRQHERLLAEHDLLAAQQFSLEERLGREDDDRQAAELQDELDEIKDAQRDLDREIDELWSLTARDA